MSGRLCGVILVARPGRMYASLRVMLKSLFPQAQIRQTEDLLSVRLFLTAGRPLLVLVDAGLPRDEGWHIAAEVKQNYPLHHAILLAHHPQQVERACQAGWDVLLLEGMTAVGLSAAIGRFLEN
ncbi:MAG: response regulator transcription factor [Chloroflexi bacterium]|nr:response regulator transcription factor [Chloroflexota bacterium]